MRSDHEISSKLADAAPVVRATARSKAAHRRTERRARDAARVVRPVSMISATSRPGRLSERSRVVLMVGFSALAHAGLGAIALFAGTDVSARGPAADRELVTIREVISSVPAASMNSRSIEPAPLDPPSSALVPLETPKAPEPPKEKKPTNLERPLPKRPQEGSNALSDTQSQSEPEPVLAGDPIDVPSNPTAQPRRRIVGLSYESTAEGTGPSYAVGNTRMGQTGKVAVDKRDVEPAAPGGVQRSPVPVSSGVAFNEVAAFIPSAGKLEKPKRLSKIELPYPSLLMARGVEGDVVVRIHILENGAVSKVDVVRGSGHEEFDAAARRAALRERFSPARRRGEPIDYVLEYTYRFRLKQA